MGKTTTLTKNVKLSVLNAEYDIPKTKYMRGGTELNMKSSVKFEQNLWFPPNSKIWCLPKTLLPLKDRI